MNSYACHFARTLPETATDPGDGGRLRPPQRADRAADNGPVAATGLDRSAPLPDSGQLSSRVEKNAVWRGGGGCMHVDGGSMRGR